MAGREVGLPAIWSGVESAHLRVGGRLRDQLGETGHAGRLSDLDRLPELGGSAIRYPVLWGRGPGGRLIPDGTDLPWADARIERLAALGQQPIPELLHHGFGPADADPLDPDWPARFAAYAGEIARRYPHIRDWLPINEPLTTARFAGLYGWWWPHRRDQAAFTTLLLHQCLAIRGAARAIRDAIPDARIIVNEDAGTIRGTPEVARAVAHDETRRWLAFDLLTGRVVPGHPLWASLARVPGAEAALASLADDPEPPDILGLDYYLTSDRWLDHRTEAFPEPLVGGGHGLRYADAEAVRVDGLSISGFETALRSAWARYGIPVALTEVQLTGEPDDEVCWWREAWSAALEACAHGVDVVAVTAWSVFGSWDWDSLLRASGRTWVPGCLTPPTSPTDAVAARRLIEAVATSGPDIDTTDDLVGWWRRPDRARYHPWHLSVACNAETRSVGHAGHGHLPTVGPHPRRRHEETP